MPVRTKVPVTLPADPARSAVIDTPEDQAFAGIPGWLMFMDPAFPRGRGLRNRVVKNASIEPVDPRDVSLASFGGKTVIAPELTSVRRLVGPVDIPPTEFTWFCSVYITTVAPTGLRPLVLHLNTPAPAPGFRVDINQAGAVLVASSGVTVRLLGPVLPEAAWNFVMVTFSVEKGLAIWLNGVKSVANPSDTTPLADEYLATQWLMWHSNSGSGLLYGGITGLLSRDLSIDANAPYRRMIEAFMLDYYGIAP